MTRPAAVTKNDDVAVTVMMTRGQHARLTQLARDFGKRMTGRFVRSAVEYVLDEVEAGRTPEAFAEFMTTANLPEGGGQ